MKTKIGSNQFKTKYNHERMLSWMVALFIIWILAFCLRLIYWGFVIKDANAQETPRVYEVSGTPTPTPTIPPSEEEKIINYIKTIFGKDWKVACAVAKAESGLRPTAALQWEKENSRGIFQINIMSDYAKVHYDRIPGETLEEKIKWLENPENNTLLAYWIFSRAGNFNAWTAYTRGTYEVKLDECN